MAAIPISEVLVGIYVGFLAGIFPAFIAFSIGFGFKYFTNITVPGLGVVVLGGALAGVSGGLMGLVDPTLTESWTGVTAILVILMASLWAHGQGDKLAAATPRGLTLRSLRMHTLSADLADRVDSYGQVRIRPVGPIQDLEGYPALPDDLRAEIAGRSWRFPGKLPVEELEERLAEQLERDHELTEVEVTIKKSGGAQISAAPSAAGLSRRVDPGKRAVTLETLLPTGVARGDSVTIQLPDGDVTGPVVSARTISDTPQAAPDESETNLKELPGVTPEAGKEGDEDSQQPPLKAPTTTGGGGQVTVSLPKSEALRAVNADFAPMRIHSQGEQAEFEAIGVLKGDGNRFRKVVLGEKSPLVGKTIGTADVRDTYGVAILAIKRPGERIIAPRGGTELEGGDTLIVVGRSESLPAFVEVAA